MEDILLGHMGSKRGFHDLKGHIGDWIRQKFEFGSKNYEKVRHFVPKTLIIYNLPLCIPIISNQIFMIFKFFIQNLFLYMLF